MFPQLETHLNITQLDGVADSSSDTEGDDDDDDDLGLVGDNEFLGLINGTEEEELEEEEVMTALTALKRSLSRRGLSLSGMEDACSSYSCVLFCLK